MMSSNSDENSKVRSAEDEVNESVQRLDDALERLEGVLEQRKSEVSGKVRDIGIGIRDEMEGLRLKADGVLDEVHETITEPRRKFDSFVNERVSRAEDYVFRKRGEIQHDIENTMEQFKNRVLGNVHEVFDGIDRRGNELVSRARGAVQDASTDIEGLMSETLRLADRKPFSIWAGFLSVGFFLGLYVGLAPARQERKRKRPGEEEFRAA